MKVEYRISMSLLFKCASNIRSRQFETRNLGQGVTWNRLSF